MYVCIFKFRPSKSQRQGSSVQTPRPPPYARRPCPASSPPDLDVYTGNENELQWKWITALCQQLVAWSILPRTLRTILHSATLNSFTLQTPTQINGSDLLNKDQDQYGVGWELWFSILISISRTFWRWYKFCALILFLRFVTKKCKMEYIIFL